MQDKIVKWCQSVLGMLMIFLGGSCGGSYSVNADLASQLPENIDYNFDVQPILSDRCYRCHGPDENARKAELRLDTREGIFHKSTSGTTPVSPGSPGKSGILERIISDDPEYRMPPPESKLSLTEREIAILSKWIEQGARWKPHWSFIPPEHPPLPEVSQAQWAKNEIDYFVLSQLEMQGLTPNTPAEKETLIRRVTLDLTGLPPTIEEIDNFKKDNSPRAYEKVVDRLLESPQYGEHMAVDWLDLARYADTHGYQADFYRPHWPWRDWVIEAFNQNMPFDQFVTWQLAGDLLPGATTQQILATGFNRNHAQNNEGGIVGEEFRVEYVADRTQTFGTAFLGLTMQCARCHDHKYDPVSQKEFYQLFSFFNNVAESGQTTFYQPDMPGPTLLLPEKEHAEQIAYIEKMMAEKEQEIEQYKEQRSTSSQAIPLDAGSFDSSKDLVGYIPLENVRNELVNNRADNDMNGQIVDPVSSKLSQDPPEQISGVTGKGLRLTGDDALSFPGLGRFDRTDPFSIGLWVKIPSQLDHGVIFHSNKGSALYTYKGYQLSVEDGKFDVRLAHNFPYNAIHLLSQGSISRDKWVHIMLTYDGSSHAAGTRLYLDGRRVQLDIVQDNLYKDIVFHPEDGTNKPPVDQHLKIGARWRGKGFTNGGVDEIHVYSRELTALEVQMLSGAKKEEKSEKSTEKSNPGDRFEYYLANRDPDYSQLLRELKSLRETYNQLVEQVFEVMVIDEMDQPRAAFVLNRGIYNEPLEAVEPATPQAVMQWDKELRPDRLGLSHWLFDPENPLPARVTVNRFWQHYFGTGLVKTADDFGSQGERPSHPKLLDWLAVRFIGSGWNVKELQKLIVMSSSYRQSSLADKNRLSSDPENRLISRGPSTRLSAEVIRDLVLTASGLLVKKIGGPSVKPYQPEGLWAYNAFSSKYDQGHGDDLYRRSLYTFWKRTNPPPSMNIFDAPSRSYCVVKREKTATPLQSLVLLNDPQFLEAARALAQRILREADSPDDRMTLAYRLLTGRSPRDEELRLLNAQYRQALKKAGEDPQKAASLLETGEFQVDKKHGVAQLAAYTKVMSTIINFDATTMKR